jgi:VanZ family protein
MALILLWANRGAMPGALARLYAFPGGDKVGHFVLMGTLALLVNLSLSARRVRIGSRRLLLGSLVVAIVITLEEATQILLAHRSADVLDLVCSYLGIWVAGYLAVRLTRRSA